MMYQKIGILLLFLAATLLLGCNSEEASTLEPPYHLITPEFGVKPFELPDGWEIIAIEEFYPMQAGSSLLNPEYEEIPDRVTFHFGIPAEKNVFDLEQFNEGKEHWLAKYAVTAKERFGSLYIKKFNEPIEDKSISIMGLPIASFEDLVKIEVNNQEVYYYTHPSEELPWFYLWYSKDQRYRYYFAFDSDNPSLRRKPLEEGIEVLERLTQVK